VAEELGVQYVVEGSVRHSPTRLRVAVQLIDAANDHHIWAENYDRPTGDLFDLQDEITRSIVGVLVPALSIAEQSRSLRDHRPNINSWQAYQRGLAYFYRPYSDENHAETRRLFDLSIELDPGFSDAHAMIALMGIYVISGGQSSYSATTAEVIEEAEKEAKLAVEFEDSSALAHMVLGRIYGINGDMELGIIECETAVRLNPNLAIAHFELGFIFTMADRHGESISCFDQAIRLSPNDPARWNFYLTKGLALYGWDSFEDAIVCFREAARLRPTAFWPPIFLTVCFYSLDRMDEANASLEEALKIKPDLNCRFFSRFIEGFPKAPRHAIKLLEDLINVGLPQ